MLGLRVGLAFAVGVFGITCAALFVRYALPAPPIVTGFHRMAIASVLLAIALRAQTWLSGPVEPRRSARSAGWRRAWLLALAAGACFGSDIAMWHSALVRTSVANATLQHHALARRLVHGIRTAQTARSPESASSRSTKRCAYGRRCRRDGAQAEVESGDSMTALQSSSPIQSSREARAACGGRMTEAA